MNKKLIVITLPILGLIGCSSLSVTSVVVSDKSITTRTFGDNFDINSVNLDVTYEDGSSKTFSDNDLTYKFENNHSMFEESTEVKIFKSDNENTSATLNFKTASRKSLSLLMIGNSFSDDTIQYMYEICKDLDIDCKVEDLYIGSCSLDQHYDNFTNDYTMYDRRYYVDGTWKKETFQSQKTAIESYAWDYVSIQQVSNGSGLVETYSNLDSYVESLQKELEKNGHSQLVWNMTWAYDVNSTNASFADYNNDQMTMYNGIINAVKTKVLTNENIKTVIPNGTAIQNARTSYLVNRLTRDTYHLSLDLGRFIAGLTAVKALTNADINNLTYRPEGVSEKDLLVVKESVNNALNSKYEVTNSVYTSED